MKSGIFWAIGLLVVLVGVETIIAVPCGTSSGFLPAFDGSSAIVLAENMANLYALHDDGTPNTIASIGMKWTGVQEFTRLDTSKCGEPDQYPIPDARFGITVQRTVDFNDMDCTISRSTEVWDEELSISTLSMVATHPLYPDLLLVTNVTTPSATRNITVYEPSERTIQYFAGQFKLSFQIDHWPWAYTASNMSYLVATFNASFTVPSAFNATSRMVGEDNVMEVVTHDHTVLMRQVFDGAFYLDDERLVHITAKPEFVIKSDSAFTAYSRLYSWAFCEFAPPNRKFQTAYYDPSLAIILTPLPTPAEPNTPLSKSNKGVIIASIVAPISCVLVVGSVVAYFLLKPEKNPFKMAKKQVFK